MTQEELKNELRTAVNNGDYKKFQEISNLLEPTDENEVVKYFYSDRLAHHPNVKNIIFDK